MSEGQLQRRRRRASAYGKHGWLGDRQAAPIADGQRSAKQAAREAGARSVNAARRLPLRVLAGVLAVLEVALLAWLVTSPVFGPSEIRVVGNRTLDAYQVVSAAHFDVRTSIFALDPQALAQSLTQDPRIRSATVESSLPGSVVINVSEWQPVALYRAGGGADTYYLTSQGVALRFDNRWGRPFEIDGPASSSVRLGQRVIEPDLLGALVAINTALPGLLGQEPSAFQIDGCGNLVLLMRRGWTVQFGRVTTQDQVRALTQKVAALKAVAGAVNLKAPNLDYVNVMNPSEPAVHHRAGGAAPGPANPAGSPSSGSITINGGNGSLVC